MSDSLIASIESVSLKGKKNLLAFSAGVDSSALFFLLLEAGISFDIAIVNYRVREASDSEEKHAKALAKKYKLFCHSIRAPRFTSHFEQQARTFRYEFFESLVQVEGYDTVITAHQLNDQLEWLLMRLSKGAGLSELLGLQEKTKKENYTLVRPLLSVSKKDLLHYLEKHAYPYFVDESNTQLHYERNFFRKHFSDGLIDKYQEGIQRSFSYLKKDQEILEEGFENIYQKGELSVIKLHQHKVKAKAVDITLKHLGYLLSASQRLEISNEESIVIGGTWAIETQEVYLFISMPKIFKESCRKAKIPTKIRPYLYQQEIQPSSLPSL